MSTSPPCNSSSGTAGDSEAPFADSDLKRKWFVLDGSQLLWLSDDVIENANGNTDSVATPAAAGGGATGSGTVMGDDGEDETSKSISIDDMTGVVTDLIRPDLSDYSLYGFEVTLRTDRSRLQLWVETEKLRMWWTTAFAAAIDKGTTRKYDRLLYGERQVMVKFISLVSSLTVTQGLNTVPTLNLEIRPSLGPQP